MPGKIQNYDDFGEKEGYHPPACTCVQCNEERRDREAAEEEDRRVAEYDRRIAESEARSQAQSRMRNRPKGFPPSTYKPSTPPDTPPSPAPPAPQQPSSQGHASSQPPGRNQPSHPRPQPPRPQPQPTSGTGQNRPPQPPRQPPPPGSGQSQGQPPSNDGKGRIALLWLALIAVAISASVAAVCAASPSPSGQAGDGDAVAIAAPLPTPTPTAALEPTSVFSVLVSTPAVFGKEETETAVQAPPPDCIDYEGVQEIRAEFSANPLRGRDRYSSGTLCLRGKIDSFSPYEGVNVSFEEGWEFELSPYLGGPGGYKQPPEDGAAYEEWQERMDLQGKRWALWTEFHWREWVRTLSVGDFIELDCWFGRVHGPDDVLPYGTPGISACWLPSVLDGPDSPPVPPTPTPLPTPTATPVPAAVTSVIVWSRPVAGDTYLMGETIRVAVTFSGVVNVSGTPLLKIDMDPADWGEKQAVYEGGGGTKTLIFVHKVVEPNISTQGIAVLGNSLELNGGAIRSAVGDGDADLSHPRLDHDLAHRVDWRRSRP